MTRIAWYFIVILAFHLTWTPWSASADALWGTRVGIVSILEPQLYDIDTGTGAAGLVNSFPSEFTQVTAMAYDPISGNLYGISRITDSLIIIDPADASISVVGDLGIDAVAGGLAYDVNSQTMYYAHIPSTLDETSLYSINTSTGAATLIGLAGDPLTLNGLTFDPNSNTLYGSSGATGQLYTLNTSTGEATAVGALGIPDFGDHGLAYDAVNDILYISDAVNNPSLWTVNTSTGAASEVGTLGQPISALAYENPIPVPEPVSLTLILLGGAVLLRRRHG